MSVETSLNQEKINFVEDMYHVAAYDGINYWGDISKNKETYTVRDKDYEHYEKPIEFKMSAMDLFNKYYKYAMTILSRFNNGENISPYLIRWAKCVVTLDLENAALNTDASIADNALQYAIFERQKYA